MALRKKFKRWFYDRCPGIAGAFPYFGSKVFFPPNSHLFLAACEQGIYEYQNLSLIQKYIRPSSCYFDVGANIGLMSVPILSQFEDCNVVSFEPSPHTLPYLRKTHQASPFKGRWQVVEKAVSNEVRTKEFYVADVSLGAFDGFENTRRSGGMRQITVQTTTIDYEWGTLSSPTVSVIKIDVEGAELEVLQGAMKCILICRPVIMLEWNIDNLKAYDYQNDALLRLATELDYGLYSTFSYSLIRDRGTLELQMLKTETFLLLPDMNVV